MTDQRIDSRTANRLGALWMIAAMAGFAIEDSLLKMASASLPVGQLMILFGLGGAIVFAVASRATKAPLFVPEVLSRPMRWRVVFEITGRLFYTLAIALTPLSVATVILQATPLVVVAGAALIFGETVGWRRWSAVLIGLIGVVIIVQPSGDGFSILSLLAILGMLGFAGRDLASRAAPASLSTSILGFYGFLAVMIAGGVVALWQKEPFAVPAQGAAMYLIGAVLAGVGAYAGLMKAMRTGAVSAVTPFRYTRLLFGIAFGIAFFDETLTLPMVVGSVLILLSGLFIFARGKAGVTGQKSERAT